MPVDISCDRCRKEINSDGGGCYCDDCYDKVVEENGELKDEIADLKKEVASLETQVIKLEGGS